jgi:hypothetical protein
MVAPRSTLARSHGLSVERPNLLHYAGKVTTLGPKHFELMRVLSRSGRASVPWVGRRLWDDPLAPPTRLAESLHRLNQKLFELGCPARVSVDRGWVVIR